MLISSKLIWPYTDETQKILRLICLKTFYTDLDTSQQVENNLKLT